MINGKKVIALCIIHYGKEYINTAIKAVYPLVDEIVIAYTGKPSHGNATDATCPESVQEIIQEASKDDTQFKINFIFGTYTHEGEQRTLTEKYCETKGADIIVRFDADEVWDTNSLREAIEIVSGSDAKYFGVNGFVHFWKSFGHACYDQFTPIRLINVHAENNREVVIGGIIYHFSCAQRDEIMRYKYQIHGHKNELRPNWLEEKYFNWKEGDGDLHMTSINLWNATRFDKETLPQILKDHENFNKEVIC